MLTRTFPGRYRSLVEIEDFISQIIKEVGFSPSQVYEIRLAIVEACTNIIEHGYGDEGIGEIVCSAESTEEGVTIIIKDWGKKFDPDQIADPDFDVHLEDLQTRGAGLFLMKNLMDEVQFDFDNSEGNTLIMTKRK